jgi:hypothetical protein
MYALAAHPVGRAVITLAQEEHKTKGFRAVFGVVLMFGILCGGVWMLLQSSFGPKQAYLISGVAFWGCWLVLSLIWLTGVPGFKIGPINIPRSTPQYYGPQGEEAHWVVADPEENPKVAAKFASYQASGGQFFTIDDSIPDPKAQSEKAAAQAAAQDVVPEEYAVDLGVGAGDIAVPTVVQITDTKLGRSGGGFKYAQVTFGAAQTNATDTQTAKDLIPRIKPKTINLYHESGSLPVPTYYAIGLFLLLFLVHLAGLVRYELNRVPQPQGAPERVPAAV